MDIKNFTREELEKDFTQKRIASYRVRQIFQWIYHKGITSFNDMNNLPYDLKNKLARLYSLYTPTVKKHLTSCDGTEKFLIELYDENLIETVMIPSHERKTICISTQVGCKFKCKFCASGAKGFVRNLEISEIIDQILTVKYKYNHDITNYVFMGIGEPLDNFNNLEKAIKIMNAFEALNIGARRITVSTCGIVPGIEKLTKTGLQCNLSLSLHAVNNKLRDSLMPINKKYPLEKILSSCKDYLKTTKRKITLEYILIKGVNDSLQDAKKLSSLANDLKGLVNLIPYSPSNYNKKFKTLKLTGLEKFKNILIKNKVNVTLRESKGSDIKAACGQLVLHNPG